MSGRPSDEIPKAPGDNPEPSSFDPVLEISAPAEREDLLVLVAAHLARNGVPEGQVSYFFASAEALCPSHRFDVVTMNILPHVIIELLPHVVPALAPTDRLLARGILISQKQDVIDAAATHDLELVRLLLPTAP